MDFVLTQRVMVVTVSVAQVPSIMSVRLILAQKKSVTVLSIIVLTSVIVLSMMVKTSVIVLSTMVLLSVIVLLTSI